MNSRSPQRPNTPPTSRRSELTAQITALHQQQIESLREATFTGWTPEQKVEHEERKDRIAELQRELNDLLLPAENRNSA